MAMDVSKAKALKKETFHVICEVEGGVVVDSDMSENNIKDMMKMAVTIADNTGQFRENLLIAFTSQYSVIKKLSQINENKNINEITDLYESNNGINNENNDKNLLTHNTLNIKSNNVQSKGRKKLSNNFKITKMIYETVSSTDKSRVINADISDQPANIEYHNQFPDQSASAGSPAETISG